MNIFDVLAVAGALLGGFALCLLIGGRKRLGQTRPVCDCSLCERDR